MKEQELRDIFHDYRPAIVDNDEFMDRLMAQMDAADARELVLPADGLLLQLVEVALPAVENLLAEGFVFLYY